MKKFGKGRDGGGYGRGSGGYSSKKGGYGKKGKGGYGKSSYKKGGDEENPFTRIGSIASTKNTDEEFLEMLADSNACLWLNVYLPKGVESVEIDNNTKILLRLKAPKNSPEWVVGSALIPNEE